MGHIGRAVVADVTIKSVLDGGDVAVPEQDTRRFTAGWNYWFTPSVRCSASFARALSDELNENVWSFGLTYRFAAAVAGRSR